MFLIGILVRPSSTVSCTGISRMRSISCASSSCVPVSPLLLASGSNSFAAGAAAGASPLAAACSASAAPQSPSTESAIVFSQIVCLRRYGEDLLDADCVVTVERAVLAIENRHAVDLRHHVLRQLERNDVARLHLQQAAERRRDMREIGHQFHFGD